MNRFSVIKRGLAVASDVLPSLKEIPQYVLTVQRQFPNLEPVSMSAMDRRFINAPLRRDILWKAVVHEANCSRVGASNPPGRSDMGYSRKKLFRQKGTGKARVGDRSSPIRVEGGYALARTAPNDYSTEIPFKVYAQAMRVALSEKYRDAKLFVTKDLIEFESADPVATEIFVKKHQMVKRNVLFVVGEDIEQRENLLKSTEEFDKVDVISSDMLEVRDVLKADFVIVEFGALQQLVDEYGKSL